MPSEPGSRERRVEGVKARMRRDPRFTSHVLDVALFGLPQPDAGVIDASSDLTEAERQAIADGEPYCFNCGKPASSFEIYKTMSADGFGNEDAAAYIREDEGTYNPETNRFACDGCYIAIGMPSTNTIEGWKAP